MTYLYNPNKDAIVIGPTTRDLPSPDDLPVIEDHLELIKGLQETLLSSFTVLEAEGVFDNDKITVADLSTAYYNGISEIHDLLIERTDLLDNPKISEVFRKCKAIVYG